MVVFLILAGILVSDLWTFAGYVPVWDGWWYLEFANDAYHTGTLYNAGHSGIFQTFLMALAQGLGGEGAWSLSVLFLLQILVGVLALRWVLARLGGATLGPAECTLGAFLLGLDPVLRLHLLQPSLDGPLSIHLVLLLAALLTRNRLAILLMGTILVATKETGVALYGVVLGLHVLLVELEDPRRPAAWGKALRWSLPLGLPLLAFASWMFFNVPHSDGGSTWSEVLSKVLTLGGSELRLATGVLQAYVLNFSWVLSIGVLLGAVAGLRRSGEEQATTSRQHWVIYLSLLVLTPLVILPVRWLNPRYFVSLRPLLVLTFLLLLGRWLPRPRARLALLTVLTLLLMGSHFRTFDPVSRWVFGTFRIGQHELLVLPMGGNIRRFGYGRDQMFYNSQASFVHRLTEAAYRHFGTDRIFTMSGQITWFQARDLRSWDPELGRRRFGISEEEKVTLLTIPWPSHGLEDQPPEWRDEVVYLAYPNLLPETHARNRAWITLQGFREVEVVLLDDGHGYTMEAVRYRQK